MDKQERIIVAPIFGTCSGLCDRLSKEYWLEAKLSLKATIEDNRELEDKLKEVYEDYLENIASHNGGRY